MTTVKTISFRIAQERVAALDHIAGVMDRDRSYVLNEAVASYLHEQQQFAALVEVGLKASSDGRLVEDEEVLRRMDSWSKSNSGSKANSKTNSVPRPKKVPPKRKETEKTAKA